MHIMSVGTAFPGPKLSQSELLKELANAWGNSVTDREKALLDRLAKSAGVQSKHLAMKPEDYSRTPSFTDRNRVFQKQAESLGQKAVGNALNEASMKAIDLEAIFFTTVTGLAVPSIDSLVAANLGMREDIKRIPMFGLGCVAGAAGLARVHDYLKAWPKQAAVLLSVELCSLTLQLDDLSPESIVASALFGDGSAAVVCVGDDHPLAKKSKLKTITSCSRLYPNSKHIMGWDVGSHGFKILLDPGVPQIVETYFADDVRKFLGENGLTVSGIKSWVSHPGGPKVLKAIESCLGLGPEELAVSREQLAELGNLSSASVLNILKETESRRSLNNVRSGDWALIMAMGPGFCSEQVLCQWT
jgi:alkylresorcinol/alkylpyrone synthase